MPEDVDTREAEQGEPSPLPLVDIQAGVKPKYKGETPEDVVFRLPNESAFGVFDGMGGHAAGEVASRMARDEAASVLRKIPAAASLEETRRMVAQALQEASTKVYEQAEEEEGQRGMGTTACVGVIREGPGGEWKAVVGNVGDSRASVLRAEGGLEQVTLDDIVVLRILEKQEGTRAALKLQEKFATVVDPTKELTDAERLMFERQNVLAQALGMKKVEPRIYSVDLAKGDKLILTSDGIHDNLTDKEIVEAVKAATDNKEAVDALIKRSQVRSREAHPRAKPDDMSVVIVEVLEEEEGQGKKGARTHPLFERRIIQGGSGAGEGSQEVDFSRAEDWKGLSEMLEKTGEVKGTQRFHSASELERIIDAVRRGTLSWRRLTRTAGLREAVVRMRFAEAKSFKELSEVLRRGGSLEDSEKEYLPEELIDLVKMFRSGELRIEDIPQVGGLRETVGRLLEAEKPA